MNDYRTQKHIDLSNINITIKEIDEDVECEYSPISIITTKTSSIISRPTTVMSDKEYRKTNRKYKLQKIKNKFKRIFRCFF